MRKVSYTAVSFGKAATGGAVEGQLAPLIDFFFQTPFHISLVRFERAVNSITHLSSPTLFCSQA